MDKGACRMRNGLLSAFLVVGLACDAMAQGGYIPVIYAANKEYGLSGSYVKQKDAADNGTSDLTLMGHWGIMMHLGLQPELEAGWRKSATDVPDFQARDYTLAGNLLWNLSPFNSLSFFGLAGYGYIGAKTETKVGTVTTTLTDNRWFSQFGGGVKWLLVPNAGIRLDYRYQNGATLNAAGNKQSRHVLLLGVSVFQ